MKPVSPNELQERFDRGDHLPDFVIAAVNLLLIESAKTDGIVLTVPEVKAAIVAASDRPFDQKWLDFEPVFRNAGWQVSFDRPAYYETYAARWTFLKPGR